MQVQRSARGGGVAPPQSGWWSASVTLFRVGVLGQGETGRPLGWADEQPGVGREGEPVGVGGVAGEGELAAVVAVVVAVVVERAQAQEVGGVGGSTVAPVLEVVDLEVPGGPAAGEPAAAVPVEDQDPGAVRDDALAAADVDGVPVGLPDGGQGPVAGQLVRDVLGEAGASGEPAAVGVEVDLDPVSGGPRPARRPTRTG